MAKYIFIKDYTATGDNWHEEGDVSTTGVTHDFKKGNIIDGTGRCAINEMTVGGNPNEIVCNFRLSDKNIGIFSFVGYNSITQLPFREYVNGKIIEPTSNPTNRTIRIVVIVLVILGLLKLFKLI